MFIQSLITATAVNAEAAANKIAFSKTNKHTKTWATLTDSLLSLWKQEINGIQKQASLYNSEILNGNSYSNRFQLQFGKEMPNWS